jgi:hypothetical protein
MLSHDYASSSHSPPSCRLFAAYASRNLISLTDWDNSPAHSGSNYIGCCSNLYAQNCDDNADNFRDACSFSINLDLLN